MNGFPPDNDTFDGELLEDIVSGWDVDDFTAKGSDCVELKSIIFSKKTWSWKESITEKQKKEEKKILQRKM